MDIVGDRVARGEVELGLTAISTLLATPGVDVIGPLPLGYVGRATLWLARARVCAGRS
jgi:hypothetical protein